MGGGVGHHDITGTADSLKQNQAKLEGKTAILPSDIAIRTILIQHCISFVFMAYFFQGTQWGLSWIFQEERCWMLNRVNDYEWNESALYIYHRKEGNRRVVYYAIIIAAEIMTILSLLQ